MEEVSILSAFLEAAARNPNKPALVHRLSTWSFADLDRSSSKLAEQLIATGVAPGDVVAVVSGRDPGLVCAILAVLKAGAVFATVNDAYPDARIAACLRVARAKHVVLVGGVRALSSEITGNLATTASPSVPDRVDASTAEAAPSLPLRGIPDGPAYLMFTSGSTGEPKCIATGQYPLPHFVKWHSQTFELTENDHFSMLSGLSHDPLLRDIFTPLSIGATLHIPEQSVLTDPSALFSWLQQQSITVAHLTPPLGQVLLAGAEGRLLPQLRYLFWGGDVLRPSLVTEIRAVAAGAAHVNFYGTTETPQAVGFFRVEAVESAARIPIGKGIADVDLLVLLESGEVAAVGEVGELVVRTRYLSQGYWHDAAASKHKYQVNPHTNDPGDRWYRTGDLAQYAPDGNVEFRGRADDQVKVRGYRVELAEVTAILSRHSAVREAVVLGRLDALGDTQLIAYVTGVAGSSLTSTELVEYGRAELPAHMRPTAFRVLAKLPLLENGKIDRRALLELPIEAETRAQRGTDKERALAKIWADVLGTSVVDINDSFYDMGGDSLSAIRVMVNMRALGLDPELCRQILQGRTIAQIASGESGGVAGENGGPGNLDAHRRLLLNVVRGLMVVLVVSCHWGDGIFRRSAAAARVEPYLHPLFNWPTPGFAIAFGMSLGLIHYPIYLSHPERAKGLIWKSALLVGVGVLVLALDQWILGALGYPRGGPLGLRLLDTVLAYYFLALLSTLAWFRLIAGRHTIVKAVALGVVLILGYTLLAHAARSFPLDSPVWGNTVLGKYSYINLSGGTLIGVGLGILLKRQERIPTSYASIGAALSLVGVFLSLENGHLLVLEASGRVAAFEWFLYVGLSLLCLFGLDRWLARRRNNGRDAGFGTRVMGVVGQLALPLFLLDFVSRDLGYLSNLVGIPVLRFLIPIITFGAVGGYLAAKTYALYYGPIKVPLAPPAAVPEVRA